MSKLDTAKKLAAYTAVDKYFNKTARAIGIGSGTTITHVVDRIKQLNPSPTVRFVPSGYQSKLLIQHADLPLASLDTCHELDITFDGADEVDPNLNLIKGGGACLLQEKLLAVCSKKLVIVADASKQSEVLGSVWDRGIPIEVVPTAYAHVQNKLAKLGCSHSSLRSGGSAKAGPVITDNCNFIIDAYMGKIHNPALLEKQIGEIVGVVEVGLFVSLAHTAVFATDSFTFEITQK